ncbi:MAG: chemotaxis protein MotB [Deltaproteobacteria bacterium HGW-Deltaproteobacteria-12]|jgi:chemotaxis protein MotB|nr:MAG: chemotaxis protein MotB [Deltaproteobacteria bacterium HGW-Deltaproteobacteria-12]
MKKIILSMSSVFILALFCSGCLVTEGTYVKKVQEADSLTQETKNLTRELAALNEKHKALTAENNALKAQINKLNGDLTNITAQRDELDKVLKLKTDDLSKAITESRKKVADLEAENTKLKENIIQLQTKSQEVEKQSNTFQQLVQEMKGEIAQGQIAISELKGKLTLDVVDKILFASGEATVKKEGLAVLKRVVDILKNVPDKNIRIEGHTDNIPITSKLAKVYPTNWELSAARAINVTKYLQQQGIDSKILSATAFGEFQPLADNSTPEGRAKNRRIAIILSPKE